MTIPGEPSADRKDVLACIGAAGQRLSSTKAIAVLIQHAGASIRALAVVVKWG